MRRHRYLTDDEYVERLRTELDRWRRWRVWIVAFHALVLIAFSGVIAIMFRLPLFWQFGGNVIVAGFVLGIMLGFAWATWLFPFVHHFLDALRADKRTEELLIRYYDEALERRCGKNESMPIRVAR